MSIIPASKIIDHRRVLTHKITGHVPFLKPKTLTAKSPRVAWVQPKEDGHCVAMLRREGGYFDVYGSDENKGEELAAKLAHLHWFRRAFQFLPENSMLVGEMFVPGRRASHVPRAIREKSNDLVFRAFAAPVWCGKDLRLADPGPVLDAIKVAGFDIVETFRAHPTFYDMTDEDRTAWCRERRCEGLVFKQSNWGGWHKWKIEDTCDLVVTGFKDGKEKHIGNTGAILGSVFACHLADDEKSAIYWKTNLVQSSLAGVTCDSIAAGDKHFIVFEPALVEVASVGGMTDQVRDDIDEKADLGRVMEVRFQYVGDGGRLRHPRFVRWRDDKRASECTLDQFVGDDRAALVARLRAEKDFTEAS